MKCKDTMGVVGHEAGEAGRARARRAELDRVGTIFGFYSGVCHGWTWVLVGSLGRDTKAEARRPEGDCVT